MKRDTLAIVILAISAALLLLACIFIPRSAQAEGVITDRSYMIVTTPAAQGGDTVFVFDRTTNRVAAVEYDPTVKALVPRAGAGMAELLGGGPGPK